MSGTYARCARPKYMDDIPEKQADNKPERAMADIALKDLVFDPHNANLGTPRGRGMLEKSLQKYGAGRSILIDKNNKIIAGNKTAEVAGAIGLENIRVIETDGKELVAVKRTDLDLDTDKAARELAFADNRVSEVSLEWSPDEITTALENEIDLSNLFTEKEVEKIDTSNQNDNIQVGEDIPEYLSFVVTPRQKAIIEKRLNKCKGENRTEQLLCLCRT